MARSASAVSALEDVSDQHELQEKVSFLANYDALTGLPNRELLKDRMKQAFSFGERRGSLLAVVFIDLDSFKPINDSLGHEMGDSLLQAAAERLKQSIRPGDTLARLSGDEFVALLPDLAHYSDAALVTERMLGAMSKPFEIGNNELHISASAGIATTDIFDQEPLLLVRQADMAMYEAKKLGRNNYQWFDNSLDAEILKALKIRNALQSGIDNKQFELHYQPVFNLHNNELIGCEALVRWNHPSMGLVSPVDFISVAENTGQIVPLSRWILHRACKDFKKVKDLMASEAVISVNISAIHLLRTEFVTDISNALAAAGLEARYLQLEMTETVMVDHPELAIEKLTELKAMGVRIALDDFGTGYSSLSYLKSLPVDVVKVDRSFINELVNHRHDAAITEAIISMAHHLRLKVIAEGVETSAQRDYLRRCGCDAMQGFLLARPMSKITLTEFLESYKATIEQDDKELTPRILVVDDEDNVRKSLRRLLVRDGYQVLTANGAQEGFDILAQNRINVVISDHRMPNMTGVDFMTHTRSMYPDTARIVLTAYQDEEALSKAVNEGEVFRFLTKPWDDEKLRQVVREAI
ncbi:EAL domain-containing protein [Idiomarina seosinensis]|uniref:cyclic-guanylate-specific phosphodiesterase n=1 Tax=Idiomarina seosinensis TaxID=281739 RepID=A0A432ZG95_9GAMM|nr:EAL domain-containing protein [Idiomarina seosinensis]RUO77017.1 GGDEF domain-containing protein [Idiomarina seosinensis]